MIVFKRLPKKLKVRNKVYKVRFVEELDDGKLAGLCDFEDQEIHVATDFGYNESESTLLHELLHAISHEYGFDLSENKVLSLEEAIYKTFLKNGWKIVVAPKRKRTSKK